MHRCFKKLLFFEDYCVVCLFNKYYLISYDAEIKLDSKGPVPSTEKSIGNKKNSYSTNFIIFRDQSLQPRSERPLPRDDSKKGPQSAESHRDRLLPPQSTQDPLQSQVWVDQFPERSCRANQENHQVLYQASQLNGNVLLNCIFFRSINSL